MSGRWPFTAEKIATRIALIAPYVFRRRVDLPPFRFLPLADASEPPALHADPAGWEVIEHQSYWGAADLNFILKSTLEVPEGWDAAQLALHLPLGVLGDIFNHPEALVHVDGDLIGSADRYHHTIALDPDLADGQAHPLALVGWTGHSGWPPDPTSRAKLHMGRPALVERDPVLQAFHDLAQAMLDAAQVQEPETAEHQGLIAALDAAFKVLDTRDPIGAALYETAPAALEVLREGRAAAGAPLDVTLHGIGHAHIDIAYLWPIAQTRRKNARTCSNVLRLMERDEGYHFSHSQPQLYAMMAQDYPALFDAIKARVAQGRWEVMGGMWVEPDLNIPGPEALVRQLLLGRRYFRETFGDVETPVLWLPDTFGFPAQIPQLMRHAGLEWFATNKLNWNQLNRVPSSSHIWEGLDGSRVLAHVLTTPREVQYLPFPTNYKSDLSAAEVLGTWTGSTAQDHVRDLPICYGYGDGGGGPTEDLLAKAHAHDAMPGMPRVEMSTVRRAFEAIARTADSLPVHRGEHYMEGHRGVLTSQGWIKRANRKAEWALHEAEALSAMAGLTPDLREAWELLCLNQFHDIITGTSVPQVFEDARKDYARIMAMAEEAAGQAAGVLQGPEARLANTCPTSGPRLAVLAEAPAALGQEVEGGTLLHFADLPAYATADLSTASLPDHPVTCRETDGGVQMENAGLRLTIADNGQITALLDKTTGQDLLPRGATANVLQTFEDRPICWDAWDIDPSFEDRMEVLEAPGEMRVVEAGPLRAAVEVTLRWRDSTIRQTIRLSAQSNRIDFVTHVDWHQSHILLKAAFPTRIVAAEAEFDVQWGVVMRPTTRDTPHDAARFEVPAQQWAQLRAGDYAVAVLNDCKYGVDVRGGTIRQTLLKSSTSPDPGADQGPHDFTYSLLPLPGADQATLRHEAYDLNAPLRVLSGGGADGAARAFVASSNPAIVLRTLKPAEDGDGVILRLYEAEGSGAETMLTFASPPREAVLVDFLEDMTEAVPVVGNGLSLTFGPYEIKSLRLRL